MVTVPKIIADLQGPSKVAALTGVHRTRVHSWMKTGRIPVDHWAKIIEASNGKVTADDLVLLSRSGEVAA